MQGITLYIILGVLVGAVIIFLLVTSLVDRKKRTQLKNEKIVEDKLKKDAVMHVALVLAYIIQQNALLLKDFVPSIGQLKMSNIRAKARQSLLLLEKSRAFTFVKAGENQALIATFYKLKDLNSNTWTKKLKDDMQAMDNLIKTNQDVKATDRQVQDITGAIAEVYKHESTK